MPHIGQKLWKHDENRRVYTHDDGTKSHSPIFIKSFVDWFVVGETPRSWLVSYINSTEEWRLKRAVKIPKNETLLENGFYDSWQAVEDAAWVQENKYTISNEVRDSKLSRSQLERIQKI